ncbi:MAG: cryptochrome/photolyase family protein, partial [Desulfovermiculus sp.]|nr:cryptochrome/photolyase family protein [Desulfovermiculus sp.]
KKGTSMPRTLRLILGDQLNINHSWFAPGPDPQVSYVLMEIRQETDYVHHHIQKITAFFLAMRAFARRLGQLGHDVHYIYLDATGNTQSLVDNITKLMAESGYVHFEYQHPDEYRLDHQLQSLAATAPFPCQGVDSEHFLTSREELASLMQGKKAYRMEHFYRHMRRKWDILMHQGQPVQGVWNLDKENRQTLPAEVSIPDPLVFDNSGQVVLDVLAKCRIPSLGSTQGSIIPWPVTREQALKQIDHFVHSLLPWFGTYQDAMTRRSTSLFHSRLSFALNTKMVQPLEVIRSVVSKWEDEPQKVALNQVEGFVRQILGWREFMRGMYWAYMPGLDQENALGHQAALPDWYWTAETNMACLQACILQSLQTAYAHHIQRLMVSGNFALLAGVHPDAVDAWYLGIYVDAVQWVELPNTRGMSQFADGGRIASKPYVSSANYIQSMSDYCAQCMYDHKARSSERACPFNSLYWHFFHRHRERLQNVPRIGLIYRTLDKMDHRTRKDILHRGDKVLDQVNEL